MIHIFLHELRANYKGLLGWCVGILLFQASGYSKFEGFRAAQSGSINSIANSFPKSLQVIFGMYNLDIGTLIGYFGILYVFFALMAAIYSGLLGAGIIAKEERDKTSEFLLTRPVSRSSVLTSKILAGLVNVLIIFFVIAISSVIGVAIVNGNNYGLTNQVMHLMWGILLIQLFFFSVGVLLAGIFKNPKMPTSLITTVIVVSYFASVAADISNNLKWLNYITTLKWFSAPSIINNGNISYSYATITLVLSAIFIILCYVFYNKRDITVA